MIGQDASVPIVLLIHLVFAKSNVLTLSHSICYYDAMRFYTNAFVRGNYVYVRGYDYGKRFNEKVFYKTPLSMNLQENNLDIKQSQDNL